jgi:hypothetical protein
MDYISAKQRVDGLWFDRLCRSRFGRFCSEVWWRFNLRNARWELEQFELARKNEVAAMWRDLTVKLSDELRALGIDPEKEPEPLFKHFEVWVVIGVLLVCSLVAVTFMGAKSEVEKMVRYSMERMK